MINCLLVILIQINLSCGVYFLLIVFGLGVLLEFAGNVLTVEKV